MYVMSTFDAPSILGFALGGGLLMGIFYIFRNGILPILFLGSAVGALYLAYRPAPAPDGALISALPRSAERPEYATSETCQSCHPGEHSSWFETYHRTMTQAATSDAVLGDFSGQILSDRGQSFLLEHNEGEFFVQQTLPEPVSDKHRIVMTTGSHHLQNYWWMGSGNRYEQFPFVWFIREQRWIPAADSFLQPSPPSVGPAYWNASCNACHTLGSIARANYAAESADTRVVELGVSCESCHGPSADHVAEYKKPWRRYASRLAGGIEKPSHVVNPKRMDKHASVAVCGSCHSSSRVNHAELYNLEGDPFRPGDVLSATRRVMKFGPAPEGNREMMYLPLSAEGKRARIKVQQSNSSEEKPVEATIVGFSKLGLHFEPMGLGDSDRVSVQFHNGTQVIGRLFLNDHVVTVRPEYWSRPAIMMVFAALGYGDNLPDQRDLSAFWADGTIRTAGRELNGIVMTPCYTKGEMTCISCHTMHGGNSNDQLKPEFPSDGIQANAACLSCHTEMNESIEAHTHHERNSTGSVCYNCHMPHTTYGLLGATRAHRIDSPNAELSEKTGRPNACNLCHLDRSLAWSSESLREWFGHDHSETADSMTGASHLLSGDAAQRAIVAWHMGWGPARAVSKIDAWAPPILTELLNDEYSVVRYIAGKALESTPFLDGLEFDFLGTTEHRSQIAREVMNRWEAAKLDPEELELTEVLLKAPGIHDEAKRQRLLNLRDNRPVWIVE